MLYFELGRNDAALACFLLAKSIFEELQSPRSDSAQKRIDDLHGKVGQEDFTALVVLVEPQVAQIMQQALTGEIR